MLQDEYTKVEGQEEEIWVRLWKASQNYRGLVENLVFHFELDVDPFHPAYGEIYVAEALKQNGYSGVEYLVDFHDVDNEALIQNGYDPDSIGEEQLEHLDSVSVVLENLPEEEGIKKARMTGAELVERSLTEEEAPISLEASR